MRRRAQPCSVKVGPNHPRCLIGKRNGSRPERAAAVVSRGWSKSCAWSPTASWTGCGPGDDGANRQRAQPRSTSPSTSETMGIRLPVPRCVTVAALPALIRPPRGRPGLATGRQSSLRQRCPAPIVFTDLEAGADELPFGGHDAASVGASSTAILVLSASRALTSRESVNNAILPLFSRARLLQAAWAPASRATLSTH